MTPSLAAACEGEPEKRIDLTQTVEIDKRAGGFIPAVPGVMEMITEIVM